MSIESVNTGHVKQAGCELIYDAEVIPQQPPANWLDGEILQNADARPVEHGGRGKAWFLSLDGRSAVLRHYQRGGLVAQFNRTSYLGLRAEKSRAFQEWQLLRTLYSQGLPVPRPLAASCCRWPTSFSPVYRAQILLERLENVETLDQRLIQSELATSSWQQLGRVIRRFHDAQVYHADLNANNVLLTSNDEIFLIDFDKSAIRNGNDWKQGNLERLKRSLYKQQGLNQQYHFTEADWLLLLDAYQSAE